jgi:hypothetical protein
MWERCTDGELGTTMSDESLHCSEMSSRANNGGHQAKGHRRVTAIRSA